MGIHINKSAAVWRNAFNELNIIIPDRADDDMPIFKMRTESIDSGDEGDNNTTGLVGITIGSQYDDENNILDTLDTTNFIRNNNVILWYYRGAYDNLNKNNLFPVLYSEDGTIDVTPEGESQSQSYELQKLKPMFFAMYPNIEYDKITDKVYMTFWNNVKEVEDYDADNPPAYEVFQYRPFNDTDPSNDVVYEIASVINSEETSATSDGTSRRALFACEGTLVENFFNHNIKFGDNEFNDDRDYFLKETYIFTKPIIVFLPHDGEDGQIVVDIGAGGGGGGLAFYAE